MTEFQVEQAFVPDDGAGIFILRPSHDMTTRLRPEHAIAAWERVWKQVGVDQAPPLLMMPDADTRIEALGDAELRKLGLMRIPEEG